MLRERADRLALVFCLLFVAVGSLWISEIGLQNDEVLFAAGVYPPFADPPHLLGKPFPVMVMTYVGTLKSYIYWLVFAIWKPSPVSVRLPVLVLGALNIWVFYRLLLRTLGPKTALAGAALLATDTSFLITTRWDWGPVVLQHLCMTAGMLLAPNRRWMPLGFFLFGLGVWDKTIFLWSLTGLGVAALCVFPKQILERLSVRNAALAAAGFLLGAAPLIYYNFRFDFITFRQNAAWSLEDFEKKVTLMKYTLRGESLFGSITREEWDGPLRQPDSPAKQTWLRVWEKFGFPRRNLTYAFLITCCLLSPLLWRTPGWRAFLFAAVYFAVTFGQMVITKNAGGGAHHSVLIWPMPQLAIAAILSEASNRAGRFGSVLLYGTVAVAGVSSLAVTGTYYSNMLRAGGNTAWTDAIVPASESLPALQPSRVCVLDWGFFEPIRLLHEGRIEVCVAEDPDTNAEFSRLQLKDPHTVYITHTKGMEFEPGKKDRLLAFAESEGYFKSFERVFYDYNGRAIIEVFKLNRRQRP